MASIRRTLSPAYHDRPSSSSSSSPSSLYQNGSISSKSSSSRFFAEFRRLFRRKPLYRCLLFFLIGFLLGILHFGDDIDDNVPSKVLSIEGISRDDVNLNSFRKNDVVLRAEEERNDVVLKEDFGFDYDNAKKLLIVVTPTYKRVLQAYYLSRLGQVLRLVKPPVLWIVVEMNAQSQETAAILTNLGVMYRHLVCRKNSSDVKDRGVHQRNTALQHIELHRLDGIVYFADDDNVYSLELFENIRDISRFGTWPVAMLAQGKNKAVLEGPVCNGSQVIGWHTNEKSKRLRRFHVDMSGFAFNSTILWDPKRWKRPFLDPVRQLDTIKEGFQETTFIEQVVAEESQMEGIPHNCGKIMNWHLHLDAHGVEYPRGWILQKNLDAVVPVD